MGRTIFSRANKSKIIHAIAGWLICLIAVLSAAPAQAQLSEEERRERVAAIMPVLFLLLGEDTPRTEQQPLTLSMDELELLQGDTATNSVEGGSGAGQLVFSSSDTTIVDVEPDSGLLMGVAPGTASVTVFRQGDSAFLDSDPVEFTVVVIERAEQSPLVAESTQLELAINEVSTNQITGGDGSGALSFSSSDETVATVDASTGEITAISEGTTTITVNRAGDDNFQPGAPITFTVQVVRAEQADLIFANDNLAVDIGSTATQVAMGGSGTGAITYSSSDDSITTVNPQTGEVTGVAAGQATISAVRSGDDTFMDSTAATYTVTVNPPASTSCNWDSSNWDECDWQ